MVAKTTGCKGSYALMKLPHHNRLIQVFPDAMHTIKDAMVHVFNIMTGTEDSDKVRHAEAAVNRFGTTIANKPIADTPSTTGNRKRKRKRREKNSSQAPAPFRLSSEDIQRADNRASSVIIPSPDFTPGSIFTKSTGLKSHDWKEVCSSFLCNLYS